MSAQEPAEQLEAFAAAVAHELRTPLAALSGEVDIALRRERSAAAYREALARIAASVAELVELTGDLTFSASSATTTRDGETRRARIGSSRVPPNATRRPPRSHSTRPRPRQTS